jgi:hypothetical protein
MAGDLVRRRDGKWAERPPKHCPVGHELEPGRYQVGHQPCGGRHHDGGGHRTYRCWCGETAVQPPLGSACRVLHGPAGVRNSFGPLVE